MKHLATLLAAALFSTACLAVGGSGDDAAQNDPNYTAGVAAIKAERWDEAVTRMKRYTASRPRDADGHNWLGYALRKSGQLEPAFVAYRRALQLDPQHRGAHEYIGEAWLMANQPAKAEEHLATLAKLCNSACEEHDDLKKAIAAWRVANPGR